MKNKRLVSVIMSVYNEKLEWLKESVDSILNQTYENIEFIVILDNPENTVLKQTLEEYANMDHRIKLYINPKNMGLVNSLNFGLTKCDGEYIARMDADDVSELDRFEKQMQYLESNNIDFVFSGVECIDETSHSLYILGNGEYNFKKCKRLLETTNCSFHPTWFMKSDVYNELNGYRQVHYCEDYDFSLRALSKGYKIGKIDSVLLKYRVRSNSISRSYALTQYLNMVEILQLYKKNRLNDIAELNRILKANEKESIENNKEKYKNAEIEIMKITHLFSGKKYIKAMSNIVKMSLKNVYFRQKLTKSIKFKLINKFY
ncbi:MAG TPA: hypothetical protein DEF30_05885 [Proteiniclasticum sp.]|uniref:glycosyltransferase family 2 protein n=1 Tax=Proteiniclasticum sp. TaxID=2053595 RepID=UPI000E9E84D4|nr:glycosyltransferase [Proteiniclasticum sp.]HBW13331.1 hypothetical protein [Proteiniclasticum sp.]